MRPAFIFLEANYLTPVVIFGSSSFTVDDFDPIVPVAKRSPPPTTITMRAPMRTPMTPIPPLLSAMHISSGCQLDAIQCFGCTFVPHFVRPTETAECLLLALRCIRRDAPFRTRLDNNGQRWARRLNYSAAFGPKPTWPGPSRAPLECGTMCCFNSVEPY